MDDEYFEKLAMQYWGELVLGDKEGSKLLIEAFRKVEKDAVEQYKEDAHGEAVWRNDL